MGTLKWFQLEDINLHFTGDFHAIGIANNLLAALIDNHIHHGNELGIDSRRITWKRVVDMNDRQLRHIVDGFKERQTEFLVKMALTSPWLLKSWPFSVSQKISLISKNVLIASLLGTTTKDNRSQPKISRLEVPCSCPQRCHSSKLGANLGAYSCHHPRRTICQYRPRL